MWELASAMEDRLATSGLRNSKSPRKTGFSRANDEIITMRACAREESNASRNSADVPFDKRKNQSFACPFAPTQTAW